MQARLSGFAVVCVEHDNVATRFLQYGFTAGTRQRSLPTSNGVPPPSTIGLPLASR